MAMRAPENFSAGVWKKSLRERECEWEWEEGPTVVVVVSSEEALAVRVRRVVTQRGRLTKC